MTEPGRTEPGRTEPGRTVGQTRDVGFQIGVRRTISVRPADAWRLLMSSDVVRLWLGDAPGLTFRVGEAFRLADGAVGEVRVFEPRSRLRATWRPPGWHRASTIQLRVIPNRGRTVVAFHQEHLPGAREREERRAFFASVLDELQRRLGGA